MDKSHTSKTSKAWDKLFEMLEKEELSTVDFITCVCAQLVNEKEKSFNLEIMLNGELFKINIERSREKRTLN